MDRRRLGVQLFESRLSDTPRTRTCHTDVRHSTYIYRRQFGQKRNVPYVKHVVFLCCLQGSVMNHKIMEMA